MLVENRTNAPPVRRPFRFVVNGGIGCLLSAGTIEWLNIQDAKKKKK
jgi:hypothetical protein